eukprot:760911-Hanusia_phi.AAC.1
MLISKPPAPHSISSYRKQFGIVGITWNHTWVRSDYVGVSRSYEFTFTVLVVGCKSDECESFSQDFSPSQCRDGFCALSISLSSWDSTYNVSVYAQNWAGTSDLAPVLFPGNSIFDIDAPFITEFQFNYTTSPMESLLL